MEWHRIVEGEVFEVQVIPENILNNSTSIHVGLIEAGLNSLAEESSPMLGLVWIGPRLGFGEWESLVRLMGALLAERWGLE